MKGWTLLLLLVPASLTHATLYVDCGSLARVDHVSIEDCLVPPCHVTRPDVQDVNITFTPLEDVTTFEAEIDAYFGGAHYPWPGPGGCELLLYGDTCPLSAGTTYEYHSTMDVLTIYPELDVVVSWILFDDKGGRQVCIQFPVVIN